VVRNRRGLAPWSLAREAGIESATVDGTIEIPQYVQPVLDTGFVDDKGDWKGAKSSDKDFIAFGTFPAIANGGTILTPGVNADGTWPLNMSGYCDIQIAIRVTEGGNYGIDGVMGPDSNSYANLNPINAAEPIRGNENTTGKGFDKVLSDSAENMTVDVWNILVIRNVLKNIKLLQFKITNNSGDISTIETAFMRIV